MATGDNSDFISRLNAELPRWFGDNAFPIINAVIAGLAAAWADVYVLYTYVVTQARIATATGGWLDMIAADFFGSDITRMPNEQDTPFRRRLQAELLQERGTRAAIRRVLVAITGREPRIVEPMRPADTGGYAVGGVGYGVGGAYGSLLMPYQALVTAYRPAGSGIPYVGGYGLADYGGTFGNPGGYGVASQAEYANINSMLLNVQDAAIYAAVARTKEEGSIVWVSITN